MSSEDNQIDGREYRQRLESLRKKVTELPTHSQERVKEAADRLRMMDYDFHLGTMNIDMFEISRDQLVSEIDRIAAMDFDALRRNPNFEREYSGGDKEAWANYARLQRIELLVDRFTLLSRLRDDEPEAWDEVEELYYDD